MASPDADPRPEPAAPPPQKGSGAAAGAGLSFLLEATGVSKTFGATEALRGVDLAIRPGEIHGLCGQNGAGKSTLVKILTGSVRPDAGTVRVLGETAQINRPHDAQLLGIALVDQELSLVPALTVEENIRLGTLGAPLLRSRWLDTPAVRELLTRIGLDRVSPKARVEDLSIPERQLVEIARLLERNGRLLILDEPTAALSRADSLVVFGALRDLASQGHGILYVSHRLDEVLDLCNRITVIRDGRRVADSATGEMTHERLVSLIVGDRVMKGSQPAETPAGVGNGAARAASETLRVESVRVPGRVADFEVEIAPGAIVGLAGQVGSGASETLRALAGLEFGASATVALGERRVLVRNPADAAGANITFVSNDRRDEGLFISRPISENLMATRLSSVSTAGLVAMRRIRKAARELAERVGLQAPSHAAPVSVLSGGNQQKVFIGRSLGSDATRLLLLDEPTRGVDVGGRSDIHRLIREAAAGGTSVVFASTEAEEVLELSDVILSMRWGRVVAVHSRGELASEAELLANITREAVEELAQE